MNDIVVDHLKNAGITFASVFLVVLGTSLSTIGSVNLSWSVIAGLVTAAVGAALKETLERSSSNPKLGGRK